MTLLPKARTSPPHRLRRRRARPYAWGWLLALSLLIGAAMPGMAADDDQATGPAAPQPDVAAPAPTSAAPAQDDGAGEPLAEAAPAPESASTETPSAPTTEGEPKPVEVSEEDRIDILNVDYARFDEKRNILLGEGNIRVVVREPVTEAGVTRYEEVAISADSMLIDIGSDVAIFKGNVRIERENIVVTQDELEVDLGTKAADARGSVRAMLDTELFPGPWPLEPLYVEGDAVHVEPQANFMRVRRGLLTSCDRDEPHYFFLSPEVDITPGKQLRLKRPRLRILGKTVFRYPGNLTIPLNRRRSSVIPAFGRNRTEGRFLRISFPYTSGREASGAFRLNLSQRRGLGIGAEHFVYAREQGGEVFLFWEPQEGSFTSRARHTYDFSPTFSADTTASFQTNSGYARGSTESSDVGMILRNRDQNSSFELAFRRNETVSSFGGSIRSTVQLRDDEQYGGGLRSSVLLNFRETGAVGRADDLELNTQLEFGRRNLDRPFDWRLQAERRFDLDGDRFTLDDNLSILERLPVLTLHSSTRRLGVRSLREFPIDTELSFGQFRQRPTGGDIFRTFMRFDLTPRRIQLGGSSEIDWRTQFQQGFYSDGTAQYVIGTRLSLENRYGRHWRSDISYDLTDPHGFAPLRFDAVGTRSAARWRLARTGGGIGGSRVELAGGFDFERDRHQDLLLRSRFPLARGTLFDLSTGYSIERDAFRPLLLELERVRPGGMSFGLSSRYDLELSQLGRLRGTLDWPLRKWRLEVLAGYNGIRKELDFADVRVTRDLHCWTASLTYSKQQRAVMVNVGIKAFAIAPPRLGHGIRGQSFDITQGSLY